MDAVRPLVLIAALLVYALACSNVAAEPTSDPRPGLFRALDGEWLARGFVRGEPVEYDVVVRPALQNTFSEISMLDRQVPPRYEARIFLGIDPDSGEVIAHWMDNFGPKFSVPHGVGRVVGQTIEFVVPYPDGAFKDVFTHDPRQDRWTLEILAQQADQSWQTFARYDLVRK